MNALVVDDSVVMRSAIKNALLAIGGFGKIDVASNGRLALTKIGQSQYDLMILDLEMPELDGLGTLQELKNQSSRLPVIVFASETVTGADKTIEALKLGAWDVLAKPINQNYDVETYLTSVIASLGPKIHALQKLASKRTGSERPLPAAQLGSMTSVNIKAPSTAPVSDKRPVAMSAGKWKQLQPDLFHAQAVVIASSTGGPSALDELFSLLKHPPRIPVLLVQHMPPVFTKSLAANLQRQTQVNFAEAVDGEEVRSGKIYVAPGGYHLSVIRKDQKTLIALDQGPEVNFVRPAADKLFVSAAEVFGPTCMGIVLTGMGEDSAEGACQIKNRGGMVLIQDKESSVVWGMPGSVHQRGAFDAVMNLPRLAQILASKVST